MEWITGERPGVLVDHDNSQITGGVSSGGSAALIVTLDSDEKIKTFYAKSGLAVDGEVTGRAEVLQQAEALLSGAFSALYILPVDGSLSAYVAAFERLDSLSGLTSVVCDSADPAVHQKMADYLIRSADHQQELLGFVSAADEDTAMDTAVALNCMRLVMTAQGGPVAAAALASAVSRAEMTDPLYELELTGDLSIGSRLSEAQISQLIQSGVTPLEALGGKVYSVRTVTTRSRSEGVFDRTLLDLQIIRIVDHVLSNVRLTLRRMLGSVRSNAQSRLSISTQVRLVLEEMVASGLVAEYDPPIISEDADDASVCNVLLSFAVARGYARIVISANVSV